MDRTAMSTRELKRLGVMVRVEKEALNLVDATAILGLSYRQAKRIWRRPTASQGFASGAARTFGREPTKRDISNELRQGTF